MYDDLPESRTGFQMSFSSDPNELKSTETAPKIINQAIQNMNAPWPEKNHENLQKSDRADKMDFTNDNFADDFTNNDDGPGNWENENDNVIPKIQEIINGDSVVDNSNKNSSTIDSKKRPGKRLRSKKCCKCDKKFHPVEHNHRMCPNCAPGREITDLEKIDGNNTRIVRCANCCLCLSARIINCVRTVAGRSFIIGMENRETVIKCRIRGSKILKIINNFRIKNFQLNIINTTRTTARHLTRGAIQSNPILASSNPRKFFKLSTTEFDSLEAPQRKSVNTATIVLHR
jgi:hypothetical protein